MSLGKVLADCVKLLLMFTGDTTKSNFKRLPDPLKISRHMRVYIYV